ncbi:MAG TPA: aldehyde dehydrogenase, partial [Streptomyces sp.]|nr:aldehyde dehydrogenase [Streptomyces sp.]
MCGARARHERRTRSAEARGEPVQEEHRVIDPSTEELITTVPAATPQDVDAAVVRAAAAQRRWAAL